MRGICFPITEQKSISILSKPNSLLKTSEEIKYLQFFKYVKLFLSYKTKRGRERPVLSLRLIGFNPMKKICNQN